MNDGRSREVPSLIRSVHAFRRDVDAFSERVRASLARNAAICATATESSNDAAPVLANILEQLHVQEEELKVAEAELRVQIGALERARAILEAERAKYIDLFENAPEPYVVTDVNGVIRDANAAAGAFLNFPSQHLSGKVLIGFVARQDTRAFRAAVWDLRTSDRVGPLDVRIRPRRAPVVPARISATPVRDAAGDTVAIRWLIRAITDHAESVEQLRSLLAEERARARRQIEWLASVVHEMRSPIAACVAWLERLKRVTVGVDAARESAESIAHAIEQIAGLVSRLYEYGAVTSGRALMHCAPMDLAAAVARATHLIAPLTTERGVQLAVSLPPRAVTIEGDEERMEEVVTNLVTNAVRHSKAGQRVLVQLRVDRDSVELLVVDQGDGMTEAQLAELFDPRPLKRARDSNGLGLGLAITRAIVSAHGGWIEAESAGPGQGTTVRVSLPARSDADAAPLQTPESAG